MGLSPMDYWRLASSLSVVNCAILITGNDPSKKYDKGEHDDDPDLVQYTNYDGFDAAFEALKDAILTNEVSADIAFPLADEQTGYREGYWGEKLTAILGGGSKVFELRGLKLSQEECLVFVQKEPDWQKTMIEVRQLKSWLKSKGMRPDFFFPKGDPDSFVNKEHPRYSPKLACAVSAWREIKHPAKNKTPKQTIEAWVKANGVTYGLQNPDGVVPNAAVEEIARVVNWQPQGGVARTEGVINDASEPDAPSEPQNYEEVKSLNEGTGVFFDDIDFGKRT